ncbi:hypothetical protein DM01DRAFT_1335623 [Hesseltinella vesiculosa]|uniref:Uncharacterized protein n=1 Tax=Hesseltinella vesiculosa TaxID=101127 RepID=A0A1X2GID6_9FUNG|nr:hypothetical protein DM01DRAFT_1335623 [Hesseltinella vesiculosa]
MDPGIQDLNGSAMETIKAKRVSIQPPVVDDPMESIVVSEPPEPSGTEQLGDEGEETIIDESLIADEFGPLAFRDPADRRFLLGFELRHFRLAPQYEAAWNMDDIDLRQEESDDEDATLNDHILESLINGLLNSAAPADIRRGKTIKRKLQMNRKRPNRFKRTVTRKPN